MAVSRSAISASVDTVISTTGGGAHALSKTFAATLKNSSGVALWDRCFGLVDHSLAVGTLNVDLYDLASLDLFGTGAGLDNLGQTHANARIVAFMLRNQVTSSQGTLTLDCAGLGATNWNTVFHDSTVLAFAGGMFCSWYLGESGKTVTDSSAHVMRLVASVQACTLDLYFWSKQS